LRQAYDYWKDQPGNSQTKTKWQDATRHNGPATTTTEFQPRGILTSTNSVRRHDGQQTNNEIS